MNLYCFIKPWIRSWTY